MLLNHYAWFVAGGGNGKLGDYTVTAENDFNVLGGCIAVATAAAIVAATVAHSTNCCRCCRLAGAAGLQVLPA